MMRDIEHLSPQLLVICAYSLEKCIFKPSLRFSNQLFYFIFFLLSCRSSIYMWNISRSSNTGFASLFSHSIGRSTAFLSAHKRLKSLHLITPFSIIAFSVSDWSYSRHSAAPKAYLRGSWMLTCRSEEVGDVAFTLCSEVRTMRGVQHDFSWRQTYWFQRTALFVAVPLKGLLRCQRLFMFIVFVVLISLMHRIQLAIRTRKMDSDSLVLLHPPPCTDQTL